MRRICIKIAYDGTAYHGFQFQPGLKTIEGELNSALSLLTGEHIGVIGASRTDQGVHAAGNIAVFDTASSIPADRYPFAARKFLPPDIRIIKGVLVPLSWHPRRQDAIKTYEYSVYCAVIEDPLTRLYASYIKYDPDVERMREAASFLTGEHDFTSFANPASQALMEGGSAVRTIYDISIDKRYVSEGGFLNVPVSPPARPSGSFAGFKPSMLRIRVTGNGFLYNMVRIIAGTLLNVGTSLWEPARVYEALLARDRTRAGPTAEARGLKLLEIKYQKPFDILSDQNYN